VRTLRAYTIWIFLALLILFMSIVSPNFLSLRNFTTVLKNLAPTALLGFGLTFVFLGGGFDLSQGATLILSATLIAGINPEGAVFFTGTVLLIFFIAFAIGTFNGYLIGVQRLNSFIVTLGLRSIIGGFVFIHAAGMVVSAAIQSRILEFIGLDRVLGVPVQTIIWIVVAVACWFIVKYTPYARKIAVVGSSVRVGMFSGLRVEKLQMSTYVINALLAGLAGILIGCQTSHIAPALVWHYDFDAITACALGGISLSGGRGNIIDTLSGVLLLGFINNSMILIGVPYRWQLILKGLVLLLAIIADMQSKKSYA
jgi:ribose/xylose/arabinose/galactoside ABC-type transport system permease subunit